MKQTTEEVIHRMEIELNDLTGRICSLERFLISKDFQEVTSNQRALLAEQHTNMKSYKETLLKRLIDLRYQEKRESLEDLERRATMQEPANGTPTD